MPKQTVEKSRACRSEPGAWGPQIESGWERQPHPVFAAWPPRGERGMSVWDSMRDLVPYLTPEQRELRLDELGRRARCEVETIGHSVEGRPIRCVKLMCKGSAAGTVLLCGNIHGVELIASHL